MPLDTEGKVVLKIYNEKGQLLISRPCPSEMFAKKWYLGYVEGDSRTLTYIISPMVPRI